MSSNRPTEGPSGKLSRHFVECNSKGEAKEAARRASSRNQSPVHHTAHKPGQNPHYHAADAQGNKKENGGHYSYPK